MGISATPGQHIAGRLAGNKKTSRRGARGRRGTTLFCQRAVSASLIDRSHARRQCQHVRLIVRKLLTGFTRHTLLRPTARWPDSMCCNEEHACWERRRRIFSGYGSLLSPLLHRLSSSSSSAGALSGRCARNKIALSGEMERAATGVANTRYFHPLISRNHSSAGVCTLPRSDAGGLPGVIGPLSLSHS